MNLTKVQFRTLFQILFNFVQWVCFNNIRVVNKVYSCKLYNRDFSKLLELHKCGIQGTFNEDLEEVLTFFEVKTTIFVFQLTNKDFLLG